MKKIISLAILLLTLSISTSFAEQVERDMVVLEIFTATWCGYCPGAAMGAEDLITNGCDVAIIEYHSSTSDPFYNSYAGYRMGYYGSMVGGYPTAIFDGVLTVVGGSHNQSMYPYYLPKYNQRKAIPSSFTIDVAGSNSGLDYNIIITVNKVAETTSNNIVLHVVLTESHIPYNWQGQTSLEWVERLMIPNQYGTTLDFSADSTNTVALSFSLDPQWVADNCELTVFVQDNNTKEVLQGTKVTLEDLVPPLDADFTADITSGSAPLTVQFTDSSSSGTPIIYWMWDFDNDGTIDSYEQNPEYTYTEPGTYTVSLTVMDEYLSNDTEFKEDYITVEAPGIGDDPQPEHSFHLSQNHPNPFDKITSIQYNIGEYRDAQNILIFDVKGRNVRSLDISTQKEGEVIWNGRDANGKELPNGIYFYTISDIPDAPVKKMVLIR
jgi:PKD repeat protein